MAQPRRARRRPNAHVEAWLREWREEAGGGARARAVYDRVRGGGWGRGHGRGRGLGWECGVLWGGDIMGWGGWGWGGGVGCGE